jgi:hypothetical protein
MVADEINIGMSSILPAIQSAPKGKERADGDISANGEALMKVKAEPGTELVWEWQPIDGADLWFPLADEDNAAVAAHPSRVRACRT